MTILDPDLLEKIKVVRQRTHAEVLALLPAGYQADALQVQVMLHDERFTPVLRDLAEREEWGPDSYDESAWLSSRDLQEEQHTGAVVLFV